MKIEGAELIAAAVGLPGAAAASDAEHLAVAYAMGGLLAADTPMRETGADWFGWPPRPPSGYPTPCTRSCRWSARSACSGCPTRPGPAARRSSTTRWPTRIRGSARSPGSCAPTPRSTWAARTPRRRPTSWPRRASWPGWGAVGPGGRARRPGQLASRRGEPAAAVGHYRQASELAAAFGSTEDEVLSACSGAPALAARRARGRLGRTPRAQPDAERVGLPEVVALAAYTGDLARLDGQPGWPAGPAPGVRLASPGVAEQIARWPPPGSATWPAPRATWTRPATGTPRRWPLAGPPPTRR